MTNLLSGVNPEDFGWYLSGVSGVSDGKHVSTTLGKIDDVANAGKDKILCVCYLAGSIPTILSKASTTKHYLLGVIWPGNAISSSFMTQITYAFGPTDTYYKQVDRSTFYVPKISGSQIMFYTTGSDLFYNNSTGKIGVLYIK